MPTNKLASKLKADKADEIKAIGDYGERIRQAKGRGIASKLKEIQNDEKDHRKVLSKVLSGLKNATP